MKKRIIVILNILILLVLIFAACSLRRGRDDVQTITFWHSYQGYQQQILDRMAETYNSTVGAENGVKIVCEFAGEDKAIASKFKTSFESETAQETLPNIAMLPKYTAYTAVKYGLITYAESYMTDEELSKYFEGFLQEGRLSIDSGTYIFPVSKKLEQTIINKDLWREFISTYRVFSERSFNSWDELMRMAEAYYNWTDEMTPEVQNDGKAFFAIESLESFIYTYTNQRMPSLIQSGYNEITINANKDTFREIWELYHCGVIKGYISVNSNVSEALQHGDIVCYIGSPGKIKYSSKYLDFNGKEQNLNIMSAPYPTVYENRVVVPQSGDGAVVVDKGDKANRAAYDFLKWVTSNQNIIYICLAGYEVPSCIDVTSSQETLDEIATLFTKNNLQYNLVVCEYNQALTYNTYAPVAFTDSDKLGKNISKFLLNSSKAGRSMLQSYIEGGASYKEAIEIVCADAVFEQWFVGILDFVEGF